MLQALIGLAVAVAALHKRLAVQQLLAVRAAMVVAETALS
jgi:hypothetical protein